MSMTTRCPQCGTAFKVVPDQLRVRNGLVRCGACATVFDGRACLIAPVPQADPLDQPASPAMSAAAPVPQEPAPPQPGPDASAEVLRGRPDIQRHDPFIGQAAPRGEPRAFDDEFFDDESFDDEFFDDDRAAPRAAPVRDDADEAAPSPVLGEARTRYHGATDVGRAPPEFLDPEHQKRRHLLRSLWSYACVFGLLLLALQLIYVYRSAIATATPALRPLLTSLCRPLGCQIGYARRIERIFITSSSLQPPPGQAGASAPDDPASSLVLRVSLRNRYDQPQHWPALSLDLTDLSDTVVVRKVLRPEDYLPPGQAAGPFAPNAEVYITVPIEVTGVHVNGYQLNKFFP